MPGLIHPRYEVVRILKKGGMGVIVEARDRERAGEAVAIKVLLAKGAGHSAEYLERRFAEEMRVLSALDHPGIPRVRDYFARDGQRWFVMDLVPGLNLLEELQAHGGPLGWEEVVAVGLETLDLLAYLHAQDPPIVHRDVKPANLIRGGDRLWLVDFGLACKADGSSVTRVGTAGYCPVEQADGRAVPSSDLYALGATLFHLLTAEAPPPFRSVPLVRYRPDLPSRLMDAVATAMAGRVQDRFPDVASFREALEAVRDDPRPPSRQDRLDSTGVIGNPGEILAQASRRRRSPE